MLKKHLIAFAEIILLLPQAILRATPEAHPNVRAVQTLLRKTVCLVHAESTVFLHQHLQLRFQDIAQAVCRKRVSVAGIDVAVCFNASRMAT